MYSAINTTGQAFEGETMKELARAMFDHRARQVQVINHEGNAVGEINVAAFNEMIRDEERWRHIQEDEDYHEHVNQIQCNRD